MTKTTTNRLRLDKVSSDIFELDGCLKNDRNNSFNKTDKCVSSATKINRSHIIAHATRLGWGHHTRHIDTTELLEIIFPGKKEFFKSVH